MKTTANWLWRKTPVFASLAVTLISALAGTQAIEARGQAAASSAFEVASVRRVDNSKLGDSISMNLGTVRGQQVTFGNATLRDCILFAYGIPSDAQLVGPEWIKSKSFLYDITAKAPAGATQEQFRAMMRDLLAERFKLVVHSEPKQMSYFALTVSKRGLRMPSVPSLPDSFQGRTWGGSIDSILTMPALAYLLSRFDTERPTIDRTGLDGLYEVKLNWIPSNKVQAGESEPGLTLLTALQEQLGLRLEERRGPVNIWVVDAAEKSPTDN